MFWLSSFLTGVHFKGSVTGHDFPQSARLWPPGLLSDGSQATAAAPWSLTSCVQRQVPVAECSSSCVFSGICVFIKSVVVTCRSKLIQPLAASPHFYKYLSH